jgi:hypothetical protein
MVAHIYNPRTQEAEAGRSLVSGHPRLHSKTWFQKEKKRKGKEREGEGREGKGRKSWINTGHTCLGVGLKFSLHEQWSYTIA